jgi:hypothetical protein
MTTVIMPGVTEVLLALENFFTRLITNAKKGRKPKN